MTTPKEALELKCCPFCGDEAESDSTRGYRNISTGNPEKAAAIYCTSCSADMTWCYRDTPEVERDQVMTLLIEQWNTRAAPSLQGEDAVERVARIIAGPLCDATKGEHSILAQGTYRFCTQCGETISSRAIGIVEARNKARAILATGLVPDEAAVRADEREKQIERDAQIAEACFIQSAEETEHSLACKDIAAAIRSGGGE